LPIWDLLQLVLVMKMQAMRELLKLSLLLMV
jgi:hypothetical protein